MFSLQKFSAQRFRVKWAMVGLALLLLALALAACGDDGDAGTSPPPEAQPTAVVVTVASTQEPPTAVPTVASPTPTPTATPPAPLAAQVNGQYIFLSDYERRVSQYEQALFDQGVDPNTAAGQEYLAQARVDVLEGMIDSALIEQGGAALGITLSDQELATQVESDIAAGGGAAAFEEWLGVTGQSRAEFEEMLRQSMISQRVLEAVTAGVAAEVEQVHARHIVLASEAEAQQVLAMLQAGADFVAVAREHSIDVATKDNGGDLGWFPRGLVATELEVAAFALQPGQISGIVPLGEGFHILQVVERDVAYPLSPEMQIDLKQAIFEQWLADLRAGAVIERFVGE